MRQIKHRMYPFPIRVYNRVMSSVRYPVLDLDSLLKAAREQTGLSNFGEDSFVEPLKHLLYSIHKEAALHAFGRFITRKRLVDILSNRLRAEACLTKYPEILEADLRPVLLITGVQRTGTTMLHRLLAADPSSRALRSWEALNPAPLASHGSGPDPRIKMAKNSEKGLKYIAPEFFAIHPVEYDAPEEEVLLLDLSLFSTAAEAILHVPSFKDWLEKQDQRPGYRYLVRLLKLLQWQRDGSWWALKSPHHLEYLDVLEETIPGIRIIQTHRDPAITLPSFCSMIYHSRRIFSDQVDPLQIADQWSYKVHRMLNRSMAFRKTSSHVQILDVAYESLRKDPVAQLERVYSSFNLPVNEGVRSGWDDTLRRNTQHKYGVHRYRLEDFGLTQGGLNRLLVDYRESFREYI